MRRKATSTTPAAAAAFSSTVVKNELIRASAGTGKTYALVQRYLWLLERGVEPERIAAMTFTRKAAGEFFERILQELAARGAESSGKGAITLLRKMVHRMDRLRLGTIDAFFMAMTQCLPFELGLTGQSGLMSDEDFIQARDEVLDSLMLSITRLDDRSMLDELREAWKDASHGHEQNRPTEALSSWCNRLHQLYIECSDAERWGGEAVIWPDKKASLDLLAAVNRLQCILVLGTFDKRAHGKWEDFFAEAAAVPSTGKLGGAILYMMDSKRGVHADLRKGNVEWMMWKKRVLSRDEGTALADVLDAIVATVLKTHLRRSRAQCRIMQMYEGSYHRLVRGRGRLVFGDLAWLLSGRLGAGVADAWNAIRAAVEYRMDARYDHWLLDEFQDTSERQWEVLSPLLEEARQDAAQERSVFLVGDLKQSIYLWRQAEPEIFHHVEHAWAGDRLEITPLDQSYRSCPQVIEMVNTVFLDADALLESMFPGVGHLWTFAEHQCAPKVASLTGHAALLHVSDEGGDEEGNGENGDADADPLTDAVVSLIRDINPLERGLSCAVLLRKNDTARRMSEILRARLGVEVICESEETVLVDNPATLALLSLVQLSVHPSDSMAWHHLSMTPLGSLLEREAFTPALLSARVRREISSSGFLPVMRDWARQLCEAMIAADAFTERRLTQLLDFAATFDESGNRDADDFLRRARAHTLREDAVGARAIQVLTVHKSKGLQFDVVILPELQGESLDAVSRNRLFVSRSPRGGVQWILDKPEKVIIDADPILSAELQREQARRAFEGICRLYVAMTRAKLALYAITAERSRDSSRNEAGILKQRLADTEPTPYPVGGVVAACLWESGDRLWHRAIPEMLAAPMPEPLRADGPKLGALLREVNVAVQRRAPSGEESFQLTGREFASPAREAKRQHGLQVHEMLALVPWLQQVNDVRRTWQERGYDPSSSAAQQALAVLEDASIRTWFTLGDSRREVWVEKRFDLVTDGGWISGTLDRVVLETGQSGKFTSATILDFKTDDVADEAALLERAQGYEPQLKLYHGAVQRLAGLPAASVKTVLIFTTACRLWPVDLKGR